MSNLTAETQQHWSFFRFGQKLGRSCQERRWSTRSKRKHAWQSFDWKWL